MCAGFVARSGGLAGSFADNLGNRSKFEGEPLASGVEKKGADAFWLVGFCFLDLTPTAFL